MGFGCAIGLFAAGGLSPASASAAGRSEARTGAASASGMQTVEYDGYSVTVPASWQVFHLDTDPGQCVRYDINAVYLGSPGANQNCPSNLIGRAQTITITPAGVSRSGNQPSSGQHGSNEPSSNEQSAAAQGGLAQSPPLGTTGRRIAAPAGPLAAMSDFTEAHELRATVAGTNLSVTATYGASSAPVAGYLRSIHRMGAIRAGQPAATRAPAQSPAATQSPASTKNPTSTAKPAKTTSPPTPSPTSTLAPSTLTSAVKPSIPSTPLNGFDACTAPSISAMKAWKSSYSAIGVYIGGENMACDYGNLSKSWVASTHAMGWSLLPIYVGPQAPCNSFQDISTKNPAAHGTQAASYAVANAANLGLGPGSPIYFDMEGYNNTNTSCRNTVLQFLNAWTKQLHASGYVSGVYSSAASGISDLVAAGGTITQPDALWFALWDKKNNLTGTPYLPASRWASDRDKQYQGNQNVKVGGYTINIDADRVGGAVSAPVSRSSAS